MNKIFNVYFMQHLIVYAAKLLEMNKKLLYVLIITAIKKL